jgi:hypothetical protein
VNNDGCPLCECPIKQSAATPPISSSYAATFRFPFFRRINPNPANPIAKIASAAGSGTGVSRNHSPTGNPFVGNWQLIFNHYHQIREQAVSCKI